MKRGGKTQRRRLRITGQVQGVGFRPFVYRLAVEAGLSGFVVNDARGVTIEAQGTGEAMDGFSRRLGEQLPPLAEIGSCRRTDLPPVKDEENFEIRPSEGGELADAQVTVDTSICPDCLREMNDPADPRHRYPFINCTNCGPRYTIVRRIPYDRPNTTMADFAMCPLCAGEYRDPASRRFHAQPIACPTCGPAVWLIDPRGRQISCDEPVRQAAEMLRAGRIVAIKGLGGFHIACRADDDHAVGRLRERKRRDAKPFAVMAADIEQISQLCEVSPQARELLTGPLRPIVLLPRCSEARLAASLAEGLNTLGVMLPYTPLHYLLFACGRGPLVMTSGNYSQEPLVKDNDDAVAHLGRIADAILIHNRRIERRIDDSVLQQHRDGEVSMVRRSRGYAPRPIRLGDDIATTEDATVLAVGAELKNAVCMLRGGRAMLSEHIGDLTDGRGYRHFIDTINHLEALFEFRPSLIAADMHPAYLSSQYALRRSGGELPGREALPIIRVQHHHAHVVSCLAEHGLSGPVIGIVCDGVGYGDDGAVWGCEILQADTQSYRRLGHLKYIPLPGGDAAAVETCRPAIAALHETFGPACADMPLARRLAGSEEKLHAILEMLDRRVNCPASSSLGRWFDAIACLAGVAETNRFEGEAPMKLESAIRPGVREAYGYRVIMPNEAGPFLIDLGPMVEDIVDDLTSGAAAGLVAAKFHNTAADFLADAARRARDLTGLGTVALTGGCFANRYLTAELTHRLREDGFEVLRHLQVPCNDGGVALGQAVVAAARTSRRPPTAAASAKVSRTKP